ncbi:MAG: hypothetical protein KAY32_15485 [Candidatus Eisenbacteria sp.]|nr:hypothetical protein [Candidatus Eisenbacteria bacterium]
MNEKQREEATALILISIEELDKMRKRIKELMERLSRLYNIIISPEP